MTRLQDAMRPCGELIKAHAELEEALAPIERTDTRSPEHWELAELGRLHLRAHLGSGVDKRLNAFLKSAVVLSIATWQALVEDVALLVADAPNGNPEQVSEVSRFATPNWDKTSRLLRTVSGLDLMAEESFMQPPVVLPRSRRYLADYGAVKQELDWWVDVRHAIAHGDEELPDFADAPPSVRSASLDRDATSRCVNFLDELGRRVVDLAPGA